MSKYDCRLCNTKCSNLPTLAIHLHKYHNICTEEAKKEYYDRYYKQSNEGICLACGKNTSYYHWKYKNFCNRSCQMEYNRPKMLKTMKKRYGAEYAAQSIICRTKMEQTCLDKYGVKSCWFTEESKLKAKKANSTKESKAKRKLSIKNTMLNKYGVTSNFCRPEVKQNSHNEIANNKRKQTCLKHYGVEHVGQSELVKNKAKRTLLQRYGVENPFQLEKAQKNKNSPEARRKANITMRKNGHKSKAEDILAKYLLDNNIKFITEYSSNIYPFNCDFYLPKYDLYIELNIFPMHNNRFYDNTNKQDRQELKKLKEKAKVSDWYTKMIEVWYNRDPIKKEYAIKNNLNYCVIWNYDNLYNLIDIIKNHKRNLKNFGQKF